MQTFLPYADFHKSAQVLDVRRLGKQRVETLQILKALAGNSGWKHHPAVQMWRGYENSLIDYGVAICNEWISRGYKDSCRDKILAFRSDFDSTNLPPWLGSEKFHKSHRSNLLRKHFFHYCFYFNEPTNLEYFWP